MSAVLVMLLAGCGGSGDLGSDAGLATDELVGLDLARREVAPLAAGASATSGRIVFRRITTTMATTGRPLADNLVEGDERPNATIALGEYLIATTELTQGQWRALAGSEPWLDLLDTVGIDAARLVGDALPAVGMTRAQVEAACRSGSPAGWRLTLPTAAQWEHAALAGASSRYSWGDLSQDALVERHANVYLTTPSEPGLALKPRAVGALLPNAFGLHDMFGNVWEMTTAGTSTVHVRGGAWDQPVLQARASNRMQVPVDLGLPTVGVRLVLVRVAE